MHLKLKKLVERATTSFTAVEGSRTPVSSLEGWGNEPLYDYRACLITLAKIA